MRLSTILPVSGTTAGGTAVTITGTGFLAGATVSLGGTVATGVTVVSSISITATTPAHAVGGVNVVVTNTDTQSGTLTNGYTYTTGTGGGGPIAFVQVKSATPVQMRTLRKTRPPQVPEPTTSPRRLLPPTGSCRWLPSVLRRSFPKTGQFWGQSSRTN